MTITSQKQSQILKIALFATGLAGIVAEYILSTLATYFIGDSVFQWTMVLSLMLFAMGLGSRVSQNFKSNLLELFLITEFILSILTGFCALSTYILAAYLHSLSIWIYLMSIAVGLLIGMEIPLVTRLNEQYESLRTNIASVMEKDYYGSLAGGIFFAFVGLPYLGLTYTPFVLGFINFIVAFVLMFRLKHLLNEKLKKYVILFAISVGTILILGFVFAKPIVMFGEQKRYADKIILSQQTPYQKITLTEWKGDYWLYINDSKQLCTFDEHLYHEPLVHPVMQLYPEAKDILILGAGDGCAVREVLKYNAVQKIVVVDIDPAMTDLGKNHPIFMQMNQKALHNKKVKIINQDAFTYLENTKEMFDVIIADFPDPLNVEVNRLYSLEFYRLCEKQLRTYGTIITQAASPYFTPRVYKSIQKTLSKAGFGTLPIRNHVYTFGEWSWIIGGKKLNDKELKNKIQNLSPPKIPLRWLNQEAYLLMTSFAKDLIPIKDEDIQVNTLQNPILYRYYLAGTWDVRYEGGM